MPLRTKWFVRIQGIPVRFINPSDIRKPYELATEEDSTKFDFSDDADWMARQHALRQGQFTIEEFKTTTTQGTK